MTKISAAQRDWLAGVLARGPQEVELNKSGRQPAAITRLCEAGYIERLARLHPGLPIYEITAAGRAALRGAR
jgi:DNA-binding PadR family transcriptional regulator